MGIEGIANVSSAPPESKVGVPGGELGKNEFLKMLVAQMQNQDPMEPVDNAQMTADLAQFSALEQMENLNTKFESYQESTATAMSLMNAGKQVALELHDGTPVSGTLEKIQWIGGETQFVVNGETYAQGDVKSLAAIEAEPVSAPEAETA
jgi:flagellar basal-body rod modification protein FlgD